MSELLDLIVRATLLLLAAALIWRAMRGRTAQARSTWLRAVVVGLAALPILVWTGPQLRFDVPLTTKPEPIFMATLADPVVEPQVGFAWGWLWAGIAGLLLVRMTLGSLGLIHLWSRAHSADDDLRDELYRALAKLEVARPVDFRLAPVGTPMTFGIRRACVVVPRDFADWPEAHREAALMHEAAHIRRFDCGWQWLATAVRAMLWCHPLVWWLSRAIRDEAELAADEKVIEAGIEATDYAAALVEIARTSVRGPAPVAGTALLREGQLTQRVTNALQSRRRGFTPVGSVGLMAAAMGVVISVAGLRPELPKADVLVVSERKTQFLFGDMAPERLPSQLTDLVVPIDAGLDPLPQVKSETQPTRPKVVVVKADQSVKLKPVASAPKQEVTATITASPVANLRESTQTVQVTVTDGMAMAPAQGQGEIRTIVVFSSEAPSVPARAPTARKRGEAVAFHFVESKDLEFNLSPAQMERFAKYSSSVEHAEFKRQMEKLQKDLAWTQVEIETPSFSEKAKAMIEEARKAARRDAPTPPSPPTVPNPFDQGR